MEVEFWKKWLSGTGLQNGEVARYAAVFAENGLAQEDVASLNHNLLLSMGVLMAKHRLLILSYTQKQLSATSTSTATAADDALQAKIVAHLKQTKVTLDETNRSEWIKSKWDLCLRDRLVEKGYLHEDAPQQGLSLIPNTFLSDAGQQLLFEAKAVLWGALYGDTDTHVQLDRVERELLALTVPVKKAHVFNFFQSVTPIGASGTWRDPDNVSSDENAANMVLQVEYGEAASELVGDTIMVCILLINLLQVNEEVLYATSSNIEQSTLKIQMHFNSSSLKE